MDNMTELKEEIGNFIIILGDFTTLLPIIISSNKRGKSKRWYLKFEHLHS